MWIYYFLIAQKRNEWLPICLVCCTSYTDVSYFPFTYWRNKCLSPNSLSTVWGGRSCCRQVKRTSIVLVSDPYKLEVNSVQMKHANLTVNFHVLQFLIQFDPKMCFNSDTAQILISNSGYNKIREVLS